jgi:hypothetical protein
MQERFDACRGRLQMAAAVRHGPVVKDRFAVMPWV